MFHGKEEGGGGGGGEGAARLELAKVQGRKTDGQMACYSFTCISCTFFVCPDKKTPFLTFETAPKPPQSSTKLIPSTLQLQFQN